MIAIGYARLSKKSEKSVSIEYQIEAIRKLAIAQGYDLVSIEVDDGISGKSIKARPAVQRVLEAVTQQRVSAVCVYRSDRISRNGIEGLTIEKLFADNGVKYWSASEGLLAGNSENDEFFGYIRNGVNQLERRKIASRTHEALQLKKSKGERLGSQLPYGYRVVSGSVVEVPAEQSLVKRVKELRSAGLSTYKITDQINREGFLTRKDTQFNRTQICRILAA
jgi:site-specific DNA recombinase